jgi:hypothetical protein
VFGYLPGEKAGGGEIILRTPQRRIIIFIAEWLALCCWRYR